MLEQWRPVLGHEGQYEVSDLGRVRSLSRFVGSQWGPQTKWIEGRVLNPSKATGGIYKTTHNIRVHVAVLEAFVGSAPKNTHAVWLNGDTSDNRLSNLRWSDPLPGVCQVDGCSGVRVKTFWCSTHYKHVRQNKPLARIEDDWRRRYKDAENVSYYTAHARCKRLWGPARNYPCVRCSEAAAEWAYDKQDPKEKYHADNYSPYSVWPEFYMPMCASCHRRFDAVDGPKSDVRNTWKLKAALAGCGLAEYLQMEEW